MKNTLSNLVLVIQGICLIAAVFAFLAMPAIANGETSQTPPIIVVIQTEETTTPQVNQANEIPVDSSIIRKDVIPEEKRVSNQDNLLNEVVAASIQQSSKIGSDNVGTTTEVYNIGMLYYFVNNGKIAIGSPIEESEDTLVPDDEYVEEEPISYYDEDDYYNYESESHYNEGFSYDEIIDLIRKELNNYLPDYDYSDNDFWSDEDPSQDDGDVPPEDNNGSDVEEPSNGEIEEPSDNGEEDIPSNNDEDDLSSDNEDSSSGDDVETPSEAGTDLSSDNELPSLDVGEYIPSDDGSLL